VGEVDVFFFAVRLTRSGGGSDIPVQGSDARAGETLRLV
jgi:hypothetical protein